MDKVFLESLGMPEEVQAAVLSRHQQVIGQLQFDAMVENAVASASPKNVQAAMAMLDKAAIAGADDPAAAAKEAVAQLKKDNLWLFHAPAYAPYAPGTGVGAVRQAEPKSLAAAVGEKFRK